MASNAKKEFLRTVKFTLISISAGLIQIGVYALIRLFIQFPEESWQDYVIAYTPSLLLSVIWNFTLNRKFTFKSANNVPIAMLKTLGYYLVFAPLSIHLADMYLVKTLGWNELIVKGITMVINFVTEFLFQRFFVYRNSVDTAKKKEKPQE